MKSIKKQLCNACRCFSRWATRVSLFGGSAGSLRESAQCFSRHSKSIREVNEERSKKEREEACLTCTFFPYLSFFLLLVGTSWWVVMLPLVGGVILEAAFLIDDWIRLGKPAIFRSTRRSTYSTQYQATTSRE